MDPNKLRDELSSGSIVFESRSCRTDVCTTKHGIWIFVFKHRTISRFVKKYRKTLVTVLHIFSNNKYLEKNCEMGEKYIFVYIDKIYYFHYVETLNKYLLETPNYKSDSNYPSYCIKH